MIPPQPGAQHHAADAARERMPSPTGRDAAFDRQAHAEGAIAELKRHGAGRARCRGTRLLQLQLLAAATAINLKRLLGHQATAHGKTATRAPARLRTIRWLTELLVAPWTRSTASRRPIVQQAPSRPTRSSTPSGPPRAG